ncbi:HAL/PAL/TAL family ammonia-lyase [Acetobacter sp.]|uniref:HAL/PAL/TAL family ammonia-lyase n=1 Tax=Acetobacter sp. TaxID=440 RepID=UPI0025BCC890|nr:aromatic amino acid lyase [Acetobacter sp.]MCH4089791.1 aromatic amino acid lyase [Acetobacter sp.]MCI1298487.1 aromatic amino acid lyase [Acetobacter sp.]
MTAQHETSREKKHPHITPVTLGTHKTTIAEIVAIAHGAPVILDETALARLHELQASLQDAIAQKRRVYGLTTGVGDQYSVLLSAEEISNGQIGMLRSHACGIGAPHPHAVVRAIMATMLRALLQGHSGVSASLVNTMAAMLNRGVVPCSPSKGSVGYLVATAHIGLVIFGEGEATYKGERLLGRVAMERAGLTPLTPGPREGHALISGTYEITAIGALAFDHARRALELADLAGCMALEAMRGNSRGYDADLQSLRPHPGQIKTAEILRQLLADSQIMAANRDHRLQDALSLRCIPQVHGAVRDAMTYVGQVLETEINAVTDNPVFFWRNNSYEALPGGNGHGAPTALALDTLAIAIASISNMSQARSDRLTNTYLSGLPPFLAPQGSGLSGLMIPPYAAAAAAAENRCLAAPSSVNSLSTCAGQEDHTSMGIYAAQKAFTAADNALDVISIEFLCAAQALEYHQPLRAGRGVQAAYEAIRAHVPPRHGDTAIHPELGALRALMDTDVLRACVRDALTPRPSPSGECP